MSGKNIDTWSERLVSIDECCSDWVIHQAHQDLHGHGIKPTAVLEHEGDQIPLDQIEKLIQTWREAVSEQPAPAEDINVRSFLLKTIEGFSTREVLLLAAVAASAKSGEQS